MNTLKSNVYEMGPNTKWEGFEDVLIRYAKQNYNIELTKEDADKYHSIMEFENDLVKRSFIEHVYLPNGKPAIIKREFIRLHKIQKVWRFEKQISPLDFDKEMKNNEK